MILYSDREVIFVAWSDISIDPEDPKVLFDRHLKIRSTKRRNSERFSQFIQEKLQDCFTIDFGYANHSLSTSHVGGKSTHEMVAEASSRVVGVDIVENSSLQIDGYEYLHGDFLSAPHQLLDQIVERPNRIFAGNCLEHLSEPQKLFEFSNTVLSGENNSQLVLTVPNVLWLPALRDVALFGRRAFVSINVDHVANYDVSNLIEIGERNGFQLVEWSLVGRSDMVRVWGSRTRWDLWGTMYSLSRLLRLPFAFNLLGVVFVRRPSQP